MKYRRYFSPGGTYFFTVVTYHRQPIFSDKKAVDLFRESISITMSQLPFDLVAICILPDHIHSIWSLPEGDLNFPKRWQWIKSYISRNYRSLEISTTSLAEGNSKKEIWQKRYWEHFIRNEADLNNHINYIHYNPVKHGYSTSPAEWEFSSFHQYVKDGILPLEWGTNKIDIPSLEFDDE